MEFALLLLVAIGVYLSLKKAKKKDSINVPKTKKTKPEDITLNASASIKKGLIEITADTKRGGAISSLLYKGKQLVDNYDLGRQFQLAMRYKAENPEALNPTEAGNRKQVPSKVLELYTKDGVLRTKTQAMHFLTHDECSPNGNCPVNTSDLSHTYISKEVSIGYGGLDNVVLCKSKFVLEDIEGLDASYNPCQFGIASRSGGSFNKFYEYNFEMDSLVELKENYTHGKNYPSNLPYVVSDGDTAWAILSREGSGHNYSIKYAPLHGSDIKGEKGITGLFDVYRVPSEKGAVHEFETFYVIGDIQEVKASLYKLKTLFKGGG